MYRYQFSHSFDPKSHCNYEFCARIGQSHYILIITSHAWLHTKVCRIQHLTTNSQSQDHKFGSNLVRSCYTRNLMYWHNNHPPSPKFKVTSSTQMSVHRSYVCFESSLYLNNSLRYLHKTDINQHKTTCITQGL